ncbi:MAG: CRTAC1 family protein [Bacteroidota bacterium]
MKGQWQLWIILIIGGWACQPSDPGLQLLEQQRTASHIVENTFRNALRAKHYEELAANATDVPQRFEAEFLAAVDHLRAGNSQLAAERFESLQAELSADPDWPEAAKQQNLVMLKEYEALAYLRLGEQENCLMNHGSASCILPIQVEGQHHHQPLGSQRAAALYGELLQTDSTNLKWRWLLSLAKMTLGEELADVAFALSDSLFQDQGGGPRFQDVAPQLGLDVVGLSGGVVVEDFDRNGRLDVMMSGWGPEEQLRVFLQESAGQFVERTEKLGLTGITGGLNLMPADYDNDGWIDVLLLRGGWMNTLGELPNSLLHNELGKGFTDVSWKAGLQSALPTQTAVWRDFDGDGWLDVFIGNETPIFSDLHPCELYHNQQDGTFLNLAPKVGAAKIGFVKGVASADFDHNGYPDLFVSTQKGADILLMNQGPDDKQPFRFKERTTEAGLGGAVSSFPTWTFDYNHDGWEDIYVSGLQIGEDRDALEDVVRDRLGMNTPADKARLWHNNGNGTFTNVAPELGLDKVMLAMGSNVGDFNNDGWLDLYLGTGEPNLEVVVPNRAFLNESGKGFREVSFSSGLAHIQKGHGISFADWDQDGDQDIFAVMGGAYEGDVYANALFENTYEGEHHWLNVRLEGKQSNRSGIGARIHLKLNTGEERFFTLNSGGSFGASPLAGQWGLGPATQVDTLTVHWPGAEAQTFTDLSADQFILLKQGEAKLFSQLQE